MRNNVYTKVITSIVCLVSPVLWAKPNTYQIHKAVHMLAGYTIAWSGAKLGYPKLGVALGFAAGIGKEVYDQRHGGSFRAGDVAWTGCGSVIRFTVRF